MNKKALAVAGLAGAAYFYTTGGDVFLSQLTAGGDEELAEGEDVLYDAGMPFWQYMMINLAATAGFEALGMAAKKAWAATQKKAIAKAGSEVAEKAGVKVGGEVAEKVGAKVGTEVSEDVAKALVELDAAGVKAAGEVTETAVTKAVSEVGTEVSDDVAKALVKLDTAGVKAGTEVAETVAAKVGAEVTETVAVKVGASVAEKAAAKAAVTAARAAKTAAKLAEMSAKAASMGPLGVADLLISAIVMTLQSTVKELDPFYYEPVSAGLWSYDQLPEEAKAVISAIPVAGSLLDLVGPLFQFGEKCPEGSHQESPGGLCFPNCPDGYKADGAFLCYKQYDGFDQNGGNGELHTLTSITKHILLDTGTVPTDCGDRDNDAGICYPKCRPGFHGVGPLCWQDTITIGAGTPVGLEDCPAGYRNDGLTCFKDASCKGGGCSTYCDGNWNSNDGGFCHTHCDPITCDGPYTVGRLDHGGTCPGGKERIDGLCYDACPAGYYHTPGMPYICKQNNQPDSYGRGDTSLPGCGDKENISGLCYGKVPSGYTRKVIGTLDQNCPEGSADFGVGCVRESHTRPGTLALIAELRRLAPEV